MNKENTTIETYLAPRHREHLLRNGIDLRLAESRPYYTLTDKIREYLIEDWAFTEEKVEPEGVVIHRWQLGTKEACPQIRYDVPRLDADGEHRKYDTARGTGGILDVHPAAARLLEEIEVPLWIAESVKGADALLSHGKVTVGFQGVWGWCSDGRPARDWKKISLTGRQVYITFDSDVHGRDDLRA